MSYKSQYFERDAIKFESFDNNNSKIVNQSSNKLQTILQELTHQELKSIVFLLIDYFSDQSLIYRAQNVLQCIQSSESCLRTQLKDIINLRNDGIYILQELLGTIQNFKLLKQLDVCKHQFQDRKDNFKAISQDWKTLYFVCDQIDDTELKDLTNVFYINCPHEIPCGEELVCKLIIDEHISLHNFQKLIVAFESINKPKLADALKTIGLCENISSSYYIPQPTKSNPCGFGVILNVEEFQNESVQNLVLKKRRGSSVDRDRLQSLWESYGLQVECNNNLTSAEIISLFQRLSKTFSPDYHVFVACILSHGTCGNVLGSDGIQVNIDHLVDIIANQSSTLSGKPKVFIIQACQGEKEQPKVCQNLLSTRPLEYETDCIRTALNDSDVYKAIATVSGYASYRTVEGSLFIQEFIKQFQMYGHMEDMEEIMLKVKNQLTKNCDHPQMAETRSTLTKRLVFKKIL